MATMELQRTNTEDKEEDISGVKTANTNRRLVPLSKGDIIITSDNTVTKSHSHHLIRCNIDIKDLENESNQRCSRRLVLVSVMHQIK